MQAVVSQRGSKTRPHPWRWTLEEVYALAERGLFDGRRVQLIEGELIEMPPQKDQHAFGILVAQRVMQAAFGDGFVVRGQMPIVLSRISAPESDVAIVRGTFNSQRRHPRTAALVVEISDTTLPYDRTEKASVYAKGGILDYWIVNLVARQLEVRRNPVASPKARFGHMYADLRILSAGESIAPLASPKKPIAVADLLR